MFRIATSIIAARRLLYNRCRPHVQHAAITSSTSEYKYKKPQEREPCPLPPPPPPPPPKDDTLFWGAMTLVFLAGGFVVYAKTNPELRDWLTINAPWFDDFVAFVYQENMTFGEFASECADDIKNAIADYMKEDKGSRQCTSDGKLISIEEPVEEEQPECIPVEKRELEDKEDDAECLKIPPPILTKDICEIENCLRDLSTDAYHNYLTARDACICYNKLVEETMVNFSVPALKNLHAATKERLDLVKESVENATCSYAKLEELNRYFDCGVQAPKDAVKNTKDMLKEYMQKIHTMKMEWQWENDRSLAMDSQWQKVEEVVDKYTTENQTMSKNLDYTSEKPVLLGDPDLLLHHTLRYVELLKQQVAESMAGMTERVNRGLEILPQDEKGKNKTASKLQEAYKKKMGELNAEYKKRAADQKKQNDQYLKDCLKRQMEQSEATLQIRLKQKEIEATQKLNKLVDAQVAIERKHMAKETAKMSTKLKLIEDKLNARLKAARETRRSQELWTAGASLLAATKKGDPFVKVDKELKAIENASGDGDKLVLSVLKAIPASVREKGVVPESVLKEKYHVMENVALKVALVEQEGAPLPVYILSYLQSIFLFIKISGIPQAEYDKPPKEPSEDLDTFDLLQRARFWMERGNIAAALKYVTALEGASRAAAATWHDAARSHLETRQAAEAVLAHAAAMGLQYV